MSAELIGYTIGGRYRVHELIGRGGSAAVYRAERAGSAEPIALKIIHRELAKHRLPSARFHREAKAVARIDHPGVVRVLDWGVQDEWQYIAMELIQGEDLDKVLKREAPFTESRAVSIALAVCDVLCAAHALGVVHRDLKPRNVKLLPNGGIKVLDFGLAKLLRSANAVDETMPNALTRPESTLGTPSYMAPEQVRQREVDGRADLYSLGVILYEMITGRRPIEGGDPVSVLIKLAKETPIPPSAHRPDVHGRLEQLIMLCLEKDPDRRPQSAEEMRARLAALVDELEDRAEADPTQVMDVHDEASMRAIAIAKRAIENESTIEVEEPTELQPTTLYKKHLLPRLYRREDEVTDSKTTKRYQAPDGSTLDALTMEAVTEARVRLRKRKERPWLMVLLLLLALAFLVWTLTKA
ncbi:MAG TPA: serine/threonine-protein kinase [Polyangiaceae bacterium]|nr:serine/threonine-protein kinase [Polyangiaceae bacterium]